MHRFIYHDGLAAGMFNSDFVGGIGVYHAWADHCHNDERSLQWLVGRLQSDFESLNVKMRRPWSAKDVESQLNY